MKIFISWSGEISKEVAKLLKKKLPLIIQGLDIFLSQHDIESGSRWSFKLTQELSESNYGIICLTKPNLEKPWIVFEAGALTKHLEGRACGLLLGGLNPSEITGPLSQFQHRSFEKEDFSLLLKDINAKKDNPLDQDQLEELTDGWWKVLKPDYDQILKNSNQEATVKSKRSQKDIMEEVLSIVRGIERNYPSQLANAKNTDVVFESEKGPITKGAIMQFIGRMVDSVDTNQKSVLKKVARLKLIDDAKELDSYIDTCIPESINELVARGLLKKDTEGNIRIHRLLSFYLTNPQYNNDLE